MIAGTLRHDLEMSKRRTRWTMGVSAAIHVLLFLIIMLLPKENAARPVLTEITLLDPGSEAPGAPAASAAPARLAHSPTPVAGETRRVTAEMHFKREPREADVALAPEADWTVQDRIQSRLAALQQEKSPNVSRVSVPQITSSLARSAPARVSGMGAGGSSVSLNRGAALGDGSGLELSRGTRTSGGGSLGPATIAAPRTEAAAPARAQDATASRTIAGASIAGPIADRQVLFYSLPKYPDWAKREAVEGSVTLYFVVRTDGSVKENVLVQRTAGFGDFDENARVALRSWRFEALRAGRTGEQWGTITFHYRLESAG